MKSRLALVMLGLCTLFAGVALYLVDRPPENTYFVSRSLAWLSFHGETPQLFGALSAILPAFIHPFSFSLMTAGILAPGKTGAIIVPLFWFSVNALFEVGQYFKNFAVSLVPEWFDDIPYLEGSASFFLYGTFDWWDMAAIAAGSCAAFIVITGFTVMARTDEPST